MKNAYSYLRFSSPAQADGDSIRRQTAAAEAWCKRNAYTLDATMSYADKGVSGFRGKHRAKGVLASFLADVEAGRVPAGSVLIVENLDRLSRENPWDAVPLLCSIVNAGISVVTLSPSEVRYERGRDLTGLILAIVEFGRGHSESAVKSDRISASWREKQRLAREEGAIVTKRLPAWIKATGGKLFLDSARVPIVRQMFSLATQGHGLSKIVQQLTTDGVKPWGRAEKGWSKAYVAKILNRRVAIGEYQPIKAGEPDGEPIRGYYPAVVDEETWTKAQAAMASRKDRPGRVGKKVASLFTGMLSDAATGGKMLISWQTRGPKGKRVKRQVLVSADSMEGRGPSISFPNDIFEKGILDRLAEVKPADVIGDEPESETAEIAAELEVLQHTIATTEDQIVEGGDAAALAGVLKKLNQKRTDLQAKLNQSQRADATPVSAAWREAKTLLDVAKNEANRLRLRGLLRQIVDKIVVLVIPHEHQKTRRAAVVQIHFAGGARRDYWLEYRAAGQGRKELIAAPRSLKFEPTGKVREPDLTNPSHRKHLKDAFNAATFDEAADDE